MRRLATTLGVLGSSLALTLGLAPSASAANGTLLFNGGRWENPTGCHASNWPGDPAVIVNATDSIAYVYSDVACKNFITILLPTQVRTVSHAWSVAFH
ncbi:hypothetical protein NX801_19200 [Streptomyces sp. LP05-1]|uniref:Uncharacterized protein n=1 Tax=Streptomyces pyxinae TaxID=2970734 RepID=A0ABT2CJZ8_9ACTN|nr:hypothetical protein [Streptomyces sp. LP05-1]MCS0637754.1 hypothetical protein [Streptomyces sp. LP05-1]